MRFYIICRIIRHECRLFYRRHFTEQIVYDLTVSGAGKKIIKPKLFKLYKFKYRFFKDIPANVDVYFPPGTSIYSMKKSIKKIKDED